MILYNSCGTQSYTETINSGLLGKNWKSKNWNKESVYSFHKWKAKAPTIILCHSSIFPLNDV